MNIPLADLPQDAQDYLVWLSQLDPAVAEAEVEKLWTQDYDRVPVDMETFCYDPHYLGYEGNVLWPKLFDDLCDLFAPTADGKPKVEVVCAGGIGWGKTKFGAFVLLRSLYELSCLRTPQIFHKISTTSPIVYVNLSVTGAQAENAFFTEVTNMLEGSPYFRENLKPVFGHDEKTRKIFPKNVHLCCGNSSEMSVIGLNAVFAALDEANFLISAKRSRKEISANEMDHALVLYNAIKRRIKARFMMSPQYPGKVVLMSSTTFPDDFIERHIEKVKNDPQVKVMRYAQWETRPDEFLKGKKWFRVAVGGQMTLSKMLDVEDKTPEGTREVLIPEIYREDFDRDLEGSIRDIAGIATISVTPFIHRRDLVKGCSERDKTLAHPFTAYTTSLQDGAHLLPAHLATQVERERKVQHRMGHWKVEKYKVWQPLREPGEMRYMHFDQALNRDAYGVAMGFVSKWVNITRTTPMGTSYVERLPHITIEMMLAVKAPPSGEIIFSQVRELAMQIRDLGFSFARLSWDQYQSVDGQQIMSSQGFITDRISLDKETTGYDALKSAIYDGRIDYYPHPVFLSEVVSLQFDREKGKIDHPPHGSKDVADAVAGVVASIMLDAAKNIQPTPSDYLGSHEPEDKPSVEPDPEQLHEWMYKE